MLLTCRSEQAGGLGEVVDAVGVEAGEGARAGGDDQVLGTGIHIAAEAGGELGGRTGEDAGLELLQGGAPELWEVRLPAGEGRADVLALGEGQ